MQYELELKQIVEYPKSRIYRNFIRSLMEDTNINLLGGSYLFYYTVLSSFANFRTSHKKIDGIRFIVCPGEWICSIEELKSWFRCRRNSKVIDILNTLQNNHYIEYSVILRNKFIKFKIKSWRDTNTMLEYNYPCQKDVGFFFLSHSEASELISLGRCSEMDILLDLWLNTVYNEPKVIGSDIGPVVYLRDGSGNPLLTTNRLAERYAVSRSAMSRIVKKFSELSYIKSVAFPGRTGTVIYLQNYLSTMFNISDVAVDKEEVALALNIKINTADTDIILPETTIYDEQIIIPNNEISVPFSHLKQVVKKVAQTLSLQGFVCCECKQSRYILSKLSACMDTSILLEIRCKDRKRMYLFEVNILKQDEDGGAENGR